MPIRRGRCPRPQRDEKPGLLYGELGKFKKFSGLQIKFYKMLFAGKCIRTGWIPARSPCPLYGSPVPVKVVRNNELGAAHRWLGLRLHRDSAHRAKDVAG